MLPSGLNGPLECCASLELMGRGLRGELNPKYGRVLAADPRTFIVNKALLESCLESRNDEQRSENRGRNACGNQPGSLTLVGRIQQIRRWVKANLTTREDQPKACKCPFPDDFWGLGP
jgi:hypothetical protein